MTEARSAAQRHLELLGDAGVLEQRLAALSEAAGPATRDTAAPTPPPNLTARERDVLALLPSTLSLQELGNELFVSRDTIKTYVTRIYRKPGVSSRSAAVTRATELGLLRQPSHNQPNMASDLGKRCDLHNEWTFRDGFQTLSRLRKPLWH